jgi:hypothetical protein
MPYANTEAMALHLAEISRAVTAGAHCALVIDAAGWHISPKLKLPSNITLIRLLDDHDDIVEACCTAWNNLVAIPDRLASITKRKWAIVS